MKKESFLKMRQKVAKIVVKSVRNAGYQNIVTNVRVVPFMTGNL